MDEIHPNLFRIEVPLPDNPLRSVNSYVIRGGERNLVIDTGMDRPECWEALTSNLERLGVRLEHTDFFITHFHVDHMGLVTRLAAPGCRVFYHQPEADFVHSLQARERLTDAIVAAALKCGFPRGETEKFLVSHPAVRDAQPEVPRFTILADGASLSAGDYRFECVQTPGHTIGHMCLYERARKLLVSGDHVLGDITPNISSWSDEGDALRDYLGSLEKVGALEVTLVLPGHRRVFGDLHGRIDQLRRHHLVRLDEVLASVRGQGRTAYEVAAVMSWDFRAKWADFPLLQKWFATGEAWAHLRYLEADGLLHTTRDGEVVLFEAPVDAAPGAGTSA